MDRPLVEKDIESYGVRKMKQADILFYKFVSPSRNGVPDRIAMANGRVVFVELKRPGGKPRGLQIKVHETMRAHGMDVRVIDSKEGIDALIEELKGSESNG